VVFSVLFVCTGNICRSPIAEQTFRARIPSDLPITVSSAGTAAQDGRGMDAPSAQALRELGGRPDEHAARRLDHEMIVDAQLILTAETHHRSVVLHADPLAMRSVFTLREFGRLAASLGPLEGVVSVSALLDRVSEVAAMRGISQAPASGDDDIQDPLGGSLEIARLRAAEVAAAVDAVIRGIGLTQIRN
jgi:protein-tyrosine phosphatase